jgi:hypothetical protein
MLELAYVRRASVSKMEQIYGRCDLAIEGKHQFFAASAKRH